MHNELENIILNLLRRGFKMSEIREAVVSVSKKTLEELGDLLRKAMDAASDYQDAMGELQDACKKADITVDIECIVPEDGFYELQELIEGDA